VRLARLGRKDLVFRYGERFWARGYAVSTIGFEADKIIAYVKNQEQLDGHGSDETGEF